MTEFLITTKAKGKFLLNLLQRRNYKEQYMSSLCESTLKNIKHYIMYGGIIIIKSILYRLRLTPYSPGMVLHKSLFIFYQQNHQHIACCLKVMIKKKGTMTYVW